MRQAHASKSNTIVEPLNSKVGPVLSLARGDLQVSPASNGYKRVRDMLGFLVHQIFCIRGPMGSWDKLSIYPGDGAPSRLLTPSERGLVLFNGHTFILRGADWPPSGQEVGPCPDLEAHMAPIIAAAREKDRADEARVRGPYDGLRVQHRG